MPTYGIVPHKDPRKESVIIGPLTKELIGSLLESGVILGIRFETRHKGWKEETEITPCGSEEPGVLPPQARK